MPKVTKPFGIFIPALTPAAPMDSIKEVSNSLAVFSPVAIWAALFAILKVVPNVVESCSAKLSKVLDIIPLSCGIFSGTIYTGLVSLGIKSCFSSITSSSSNPSITVNLLKLQ